MLESKDDLLERKKKELDAEIGKREQSIAELQERVAEYERDMNIKDIAVMEDEIQSAPVKDDFSHYLTNVTEQPSGKDWGYCQVIHGCRIRCMKRSPASICLSVLAVQQDSR